MTVNIRKSGAISAATMIRRSVGGSMVNVSFAKRRQADGSWVQVFPTSTPLSGSASTTGVYGDSPTTTVFSDYVTINASGGSGNYTWSWARVSGDTSITCESPNASTTRFRRTITVKDAYYEAVWRCTLSDGTSTLTFNVTVGLSRTSNTTCVVVETYVSPFDDTQAGGLAVNDPLYITDAYSAQPDVTVAPARKSHTYQAECVRVTLANGAVLECSLTAPLATRHGFVKARDVLDCELASAPRDQVAGTQPLEIQWSTVVSVVSIGVRAVQLIYVEDRAFWASSDGALFILHHNAKNGPTGP